MISNKIGQDQQSDEPEKRSQSGEQSESDQTIRRPTASESIWKQQKAQTRVLKQTPK